MILKDRRLSRGFLITFAVSRVCAEDRISTFSAGSLSSFFKAFNIELNCAALVKKFVPVAYRHYGNGQAPICWLKV